MVLCDNVPLVPVMDNGYVPAAVEPEVLTVSCALPDPFIELGLKLAVRPFGKPFTVKSVLPENPFCAAIVSV